MRRRSLKEEAIRSYRRRVRVSLSQALVELGQIKLFVLKVWGSRYGVQVWGSGPEPCARCRVNEIVAAHKLLERAREIAEGLARLLPFTTSYTYHEATYASR